LSGRAFALVAGVVAASALTGCYASTEPATNVGIDKATLNARGTANSGPAYSHFEYEVNGRVGDPLTIGAGRFPAGASGPYSANVTGLAAGTQYSFRVCGFDEGYPPGACAQTRTFTTKPPVQDAVFGGYWSGCCSTWSVNAKSGPSGENPQGYLSWHTGPSFDQYSHDFLGIVTCLDVEGTRAAVVAVGAIKHSSGEPDTPTVSTAIIVDGRTQGDAILDRDIRDTTTPPDCDELTGNPPGPIAPEHELIVNDASPSAPTAR
jgi:hypothetical protein